MSTRNGQSPESQIQALREVAPRKGWEIVDQYVDNGVSGAKGRDRRPEFDRLLKDATRRKFDILMAWSVDRLGRSLQDLVSFLDEIRANGVDLYLHVQGVDTTTPAGRALFQMLGVFAEFERSIIQERIHAGLARARTKGVRLGRPPAVERLASARSSPLGPPTRKSPRAPSPVSWASPSATSAVCLLGNGTKDPHNARGRYVFNWTSIKSDQMPRHLERTIIES